MTESVTHTHHAIDYIEITVPDVAAAKAFYTGAFGWAFTDYGPEYAGIQGQGREQGGICKGDVRPGGPLIVLYSTDLDATLRAVEVAGGSITKPPFEFPGGRRFHFSDPGGNELAVWCTAG
jgi:predicted enzyme related to lactoylglutathione lyase